MQNRRIIDMHFREAGAEYHPAIQTNSLITLWSHLKMGNWSTIVPHSFLLLVQTMPGLRVLPLVEPSAEHTIGLVASDRDPMTPLARAFLNVAQRLDIASWDTRSTRVGHQLIGVFDQAIQNIRLIARSSRL
jgi:DNA-binding transcriptional LysR family regulator